MHACETSMDLCTKPQIYIMFNFQWHTVNFKGKNGNMHFLSPFFSIWREPQKTWDPRKFCLYSQFLCCPKREKWPLSPLLLSQLFLSRLFLLFQTGCKVKLFWRMDINEKNYSLHFKLIDKSDRFWNWEMSTSVSGTHFKTFKWWFF